MKIEIDDNELKAVEWLMWKGMEMTQSLRKYEIYERIQLQIEAELNKKRRI